MDKKLLIFLAVFFAFFFSYQKFVIDPMLKKQQPVAKPPAATPAPVSGSTAKPVTSPPAGSSASEIPPVAESGSQTPSITTPTQPVPARVAVVETPLFRAEFRNEGAVLQSFQLKSYTDDDSRPLQIVPQSKDIERHPFSLDFDNKDVSKVAAEALYAIDQERLSLMGSDTGSISFSFSDGRHSFRKTYRFQADSYVIQMEVEASDAGKLLPVRVIWSPGIEDASNYKNADELRPPAALIYSGEKVLRKAADDVKGFEKVGSTVRWAGVENNYFAAIFVPLASADAYMYAPPEDSNRVTLAVAALQSEPAKFQVFIGPKDFTILQALGKDLEKAVDFGFWLAPIVKGLHVGLLMCYKYTKNFGWAIVLLTIFIKIIFTPFMQKSFASQKKMQAMQPEMKKVQEKYAKIKNDDPRKQNMNQEIMALHKRHGVNPLGGCLPMLVQMPVLIAFYQLLSGAIELRKAPFLLWITDLSRPDVFYVTPILMGASMFVQQRLTPISDPMQKNLMFIMPIMFTFMSFKLQSGLVLYWLLSNLLGLLHQYLFLWHQNRKVAVVVREGNA